MGASLPKFVVFFLLIATTASTSRAESPTDKALARLTSTDTRLASRLRAVEDLAELRASVPMLDAWVAGRGRFRAMAPTCFHAIGVAGLGDGLTAMSSKDAARRAAGAVLLGSIGPSGRLGVRKLIIGLSDESELVRRESVRALGNIGAHAENSISGLIALTMRDKQLALAAIQAMTRITLDAQLRALRPPPEERIAQLIDVAQTWLRFKEQPGGTWGDTRSDALVLLAFVEGGIADVNRPAVRRALRRLVLRYAESKAPPPLIAALMLMAWREIRDPLYLAMGNQLLDRLNVSSTDDAITSNLHALALRQAQWAGEAVDARIWRSIPQTSPALLGRVLAPGTPNIEKELAEAKRMVAKHLAWERDNERWEPRYLVREAWALNLVGGESRLRFRDAFFQAVFPKILPPGPGEPPTARHWEPPGGNNATDVSTTAAITTCLRMFANQYPPRRLPMPKAAKHKAAVHALNGALKHPDPNVRAYAQSMLTLWKGS